MASSPEALLISNVVSHNAYRAAVTSGISTSHFHVFGEEWAWIESQVKRNGTCPSKSVFRSSFPDFRIKLTEAGDTKTLVEEVILKHGQLGLKELIEKGLEALDDRSLVESTLEEMSRGVVRVKTEITVGGGEDLDLVRNDLLSSHLDGVKVRIEKMGSAGIPTGYGVIDVRTGGPAPGQHWVFGARLGEGKTWSLARIATHALMAGFNVQFVSLEQPREQINMRISTIMSKLMSQSIGTTAFRHSDLTSGKVRGEQYRTWLRRVPEVFPGHLHISDRGRGRVGVSDISALIERNNPDLVIVDYLTLMSMRGQDWQAVQELSADMKVMAMTNNVAVVSAAQLNRTGSSKSDVPGTDSLAYGDSIGQDADAVVMIQRYAQSVHRLHLAKNRHGQDGYTWHTKFDPDNGDFSAITGDEAKDLKDEDVLEHDNVFVPDAVIQRVARGSVSKDSVGSSQRVRARKK